MLSLHTLPTGEHYIGVETVGDLNLLTMRLLRVGAPARGLLDRIELHREDDAPRFMWTNHPGVNVRLSVAEADAHPLYDNTRMVRVLPEEDFVWEMLASGVAGLPEGSAEVAQRYRRGG